MQVLEVKESTILTDNATVKCVVNLLRICCSSPCWKKIMLDSCWTVKWLHYTTLLPFLCLPLPPIFCYNPKNLKIKMTPNLHSVKKLGLFLVNWLEVWICDFGMPREIGFLLCINVWMHKRMVCEPLYWLLLRETNSFLQ